EERLGALRGVPLHEDRGVVRRDVELLQLGLALVEVRQVLGGGVLLADVDPHALEAPVQVRIAHLVGLTCRACRSPRPGSRRPGPSGPGRAASTGTPAPAWTPHSRAARRRGTRR